ncbi:MAG: hypothetical protein JKX70_05385 [Phycisphaerales bacterium]|nr:hypothetical protein [Phycisphaerales bacterium]
MKHFKQLSVWVLIGVLGSLALGAQPESKFTNLYEISKSESQERPVLLLVEHDVHPTVEVNWVINGKKEGFTGTMGYTAPYGGQAIGKNVKCYVTLGGTRVETGAGHPKGAVIRLGVTKIDSARAFFAGIDPHTMIEFAVTGVKFNQPVKYHEGTGMMHLKYAIGDLKACALPGTARNQYLLSDPEDTLGGRVIAGENATPGALDGGEDHGSLTVEVDQDDPTLVSMRVRVPFGMLRHLQDPWKSDLPGTFFEPIHMHAEAELIPVDVEPLDRAPIIPEINIRTGSKSDATED